MAPGARCASCSRCRGQRCVAADDGQVSTRERSGPLGWLRLYARPASWRAVGYLLIMFGTGMVVLVVLTVVFALGAGLALAPLLGRAQAPMTLGSWLVDTPAEQWAVVPVGLLTLLALPYLWAGIRSSGWRPSAPS